MISKGQNKIYHMAELIFRSCHNKRGLRYVRWKGSNNNTSWNISAVFLESFLSISEANECLTGVNINKKPRGKVNGNI